MKKFQSGDFSVIIETKCADAYLGPYQISTMELFGKNGPILYPQKTPENTPGSNTYTVEIFNFQSAILHCHLFKTRQKSSKQIMRIWKQFFLFTLIDFEENVLSF